MFYQRCLNFSTENVSLIMLRDDIHPYSGFKQSTNTMDVRHMNKFRVKEFLNTATSDQNLLNIAPALVLSVLKL